MESEKKTIGDSVSLAMKDMKRSRDKLARTQRLAGIGGFEFLPEENLILISDEGCAALGIGCEQNAYGIDDFCENIKLDKDKSFCEILTNPGSNIVSDLQFVYRDANGENRYIEVLLDEPDNTIQGSISGVFKNITRAKRAELDKMENEQAFQAVFKNSKIAIIVLNLKGYIIDFNTSAIDLLGYTDPEMRKLHSSRLIHPDDILDATKIFAEFINSAGKINSQNHRVLRKDGSAVDVLANFDMIVTPGGEKIYVFLNDLTEIKEMEEKHIDQERMLVQQSKMATLGEMVALLAHQWQQPLNSIGMIVQMLDELIDVDEENRKMLNKSVDSVMAQVSFMSDTMNDFRNFLKPSGEKTHFNLLKIIRDVITLYRPQLRFHEINCEVFVDDEELGKIEVYGYENEFKNVLLSLLTNSRDVLAKEFDTKGHIEVSLQESGDEVVVCVQDNGGGMPADIMRDIFSPYVSSKGGQGTGLGLYMSRMIIKDRMDGDIRLQNTDKGLQACIVLKKSR